jgi:hypothetical protein
MGDRAAMTGPLRDLDDIERDLATLASLHVTWDDYRDAEARVLRDVPALVAALWAAWADADRLAAATHRAYAVSPHMAHRRDVLDALAAHDREVEQR